MAPKYTQAALDSAVQEVLDGMPATVVAEASKIPVTTIRKWVTNAKNNTTRKRRGPKPLLLVKAEDAIQDWVIGRQIVRYPVGRSEILKKDQEISELRLQRKSKKRKTVPVGGRILTVELMKEIEAEQAMEKGMRKKPTDILEEALV
ncbi:hypothetical protein PF011_g21966 [Phytophthora fragariae]|uniref:Uncharacterized protein n=1 Tax=Phytophthora fragariae TaxID=53985 RepID=A0A6A3IN60_9STRA|nr:hypothetical protein PF011_g21966 [Phytophthora fragariae]